MPRAQARSIQQYSNGFGIVRSFVLGCSKLVSFSVASVSAAPVSPFVEHSHDDEPSAEGGSRVVLGIVSLVLVLLGGAFAGLTIALMGQDGIYLQVLSRDMGEPQHKNAKRVHDLLQKGKHWVLVTLLLSNVIVNETLPVVLDRALGGGVAAVVGSTVLIVIFGEIVPQSVCVRYGLPIGGYMSKPVLLLMWLMAPVAWPTAKLLDWVLGEDHGTVYKKSGLKTLVRLHKTLGDVSERLNQDEVTIISAVLDLKDKPVVDVMTPMDDVFTMAEDTVLDEKTMDIILSAGYSRIPIHEPSNPTNFVGMLLVKMLITYDPEDCQRVMDFPLATLPETRPETSCLDIVNFFQEGKSHMVLVSDTPGEDRGALGVITLEDVIEELIGEEIIDESDVYIDVHKAIRRLTPAPKARVQRHNNQAAIIDNDEPDDGGGPKLTRTGSLGGRVEHPGSSTSPKPTTFMMRRSSAGLDGRMVRTTVPVRANIEEMRQHLRHLGPSNPATNPKTTKSTTVKIKPKVAGGSSEQPRPGSVSGVVMAEGPIDDEDGDENTALLRPSITGASAKDGVQALRQSYGSVSASDAQDPVAENGSPRPLKLESTTELAGKTEATQTATSTSQIDLSQDALAQDQSSLRSETSLASLGSFSQSRRQYVRSGSITENVRESRGVRKIVLETASSGEEDPLSMSEAALLSSGITVDRASSDEGDAAAEHDEEASNGAAPSSSGNHSKKKDRRKKRKGGKS